ncbi:uncharacterized protein LOC123007571 [Tribolium madens]|uniref:uncharacterized protein LOC123007571 n=1 Tax=Tribolium madens TaxID=41895 RepID=UPI001CF739EB|nr:uncharacterized protein LOC123007571 [Tribolium madens]XP_044258883.1 uncharacterized protein LOC123007571 [Tribolium madens]XP_044258884.1 uncharacterized protein LOC123007571 [Tribolium madens]
MNSNKVVIKLKIRRYDTAFPEITEKIIEVDPDLEYNALKKEIQDICEVGPEDNKVIKLRRDDEVLVPLSFLLESNDPDKYFYIDICKINYANKATASLLQDAYIDSVCQKLRNMESRIVKAELLLPQLEWRRQAHMEETVDSLSNRVSFLNRRFDELLPAQWRSKMPQTMA